MELDINDYVVRKGRISSKDDLILIERGVLLDWLLNKENEK